MRRLALSPLNVTLVLMLAAVVPQQAFGPPSMQAGQPSTLQPVQIPLDLFQVPDGFEVTLWAATPLLHNPTNIDIDRDGRIWVAEGVRYRSHHARQPEGDRIVVLEDTDGDGKADRTHTFVQEPALIAPLGVSVIDNKVIVSQPPDLIVYTDVDRNLRFDPAVDKREVLLTGFQGVNHDHSLHSVTVGPDGKWVFNSGNTGGMFTDKSEKTFRIFGSYRPDPVGPFKFPNDPAAFAGKASDDGHVYVGGFSVRMNPDGTGAEIIGYNYRNSYEQSVTSLGDVFQNDNDDPPACRVSWVMEYANFGFSSNDGQRTWQADRRAGQSIPVAEWRQEDPGIMPAGDVYGGGSPTGNVFYENGALGPSWEGTFFAADAGRNEVFAYRPAREGAGFALERSVFLTSNVKQQYAGSDFIGGTSTAKGAIETLFRPSDIAVGPDGALYVSDWIDARVGGHQDLDDTLSGAIYRIAPKGFVPRVPAFDAATIDGLITALKSPAVNVRAIGFAGLKARGASAVNAVAALLNDPSPYMRGRAIYLLYQLGPEGRQRAGAPESYRSGAAHRGLPGHAARGSRRAPGGIASRPRHGPRRPARGGGVHARPARGQGAGHPGRHRTRLRREGSQLSGSAGNGRHWQGAGALRAAAARARREGRSDRVARHVHVDGVAAARARGGGRTCRRVRGHQSCRSPTAGSPWIRSPSSTTPPRRRPCSVSRSRTARLREPATVWLLNRMSNDWADHGLRPALKAAGIYDPESLVLREVIVPRPPADLPELSIDEVVRLTGDAARGKNTATRCLMCHAIGGTGAELGPALDGWGRGKSADVIATALVRPSAEIAHGYEGTELKTKDGLTIQGVLIKEGDPLMMRSMGGITQIIPADRVASRRRMPGSLMMSAAQLGLTAQDVADLVAFLRSN